MKRKKIIKIAVLLVLAGVLLGGGIGLYLFNMPHRNIQSATVDYRLASSQIVAEYLADGKAANQKYLASDGDSKILELSGTISKVSEDFDGNTVVLLKDAGALAGVSATFTPETNAHAKGLSAGNPITVKGVIRSGASYDEDLELYENVILEKSDVVQTKN